VEEEIRSESATVALAASELASGRGASGSCAEWERLPNARLKQTNTIKRNYTILEVRGNAATQGKRSRKRY